MRKITLGPIDPEVVAFIQTLDRATVTSSMDRYLVLRDQGALENEDPRFLSARGHKILSADGSERFRERRILTIAFHQIHAVLIRRKCFDDRTDMMLKNKIVSLNFQILPLCEKAETAKWDGKRGFLESS